MVKVFVFFLYLSFICTNCFSANNDLKPFWSANRKDLKTYRLFIPKNENGDIFYQSNFIDGGLKEYLKKDEKKSYIDYNVYKMKRSGLIKFKNSRSKEIFF